MYSVSTERFNGDANGDVRSLQAVCVDVSRAGGRMAITRRPGTEFELPADLVLLAMGFVGPERGGVIAELGLRLTDRGTVWRDDGWMTSEEGVFVAGDMQRGQSLIVWAIADGRHAARAVDRYLQPGWGLTAEPSDRYAGLL
jgi:glutamate synthase (NADPH/NADH) small chain